MSNNVEILVLDDPTIELEELSVVDFESQSDNQQEVIMNNSERSNTASLTPIIKIKDFTINASYLDDFELNCNGFIPKCDISFFDVSEEFTELNYPQEGDLMKVYIGTGGKEDIWKPIRIDFHILSIDSYEEDGGKKFDISGEMEVPNIDLDTCEYFKDKTSFNTCREIARNLKLGFSSNIQGTADEQVWLNNYGTDKDFIERIVDHAYLDENSFITSFIDPYYYLNFVECNAIVNDADNDETPIEQLPEVKYLSDCINADPDFKDMEENTAPDFITNSNKYAGSNIFMATFGPVNNCGSTVDTFGKKLFMRYWDNNEEEYRVEFITPFISEGQNLKQITQAEENDEELVKEHTKQLVLNSQSENMHSNYNYAGVCNMINLAEIDKYGLTAVISGFNPQITRFQKKYVAIYTRNFMVQSDLMDKDKEENGETNLEIGEDGILNKELSGFYTVTGISYVLEGGYLSTHLELRKRAIKINEQ